MLLNPMPDKKGAYRGGGGTKPATTAPRLVQNIAESKTSYRYVLRTTVKVIINTSIYNVPYTWYQICASMYYIGR